MRAIEPVKPAPSRSEELERLRRELLRRIVESEARRRAAQATRGK